MFPPAQGAALAADLFHLYASIGLLQDVYELMSGVSAFLLRGLLTVVLPKHSNSSQYHYWGSSQQP